VPALVPPTTTVHHSFLEAMAGYARHGEMPHRLGVDPALVTVQETNAASIAVVERNGGRLFARAGATLKFWVPTGLSSTPGD
jgi:hypothetical protein